MLQADLYEIVREQLALDLGCDPALLETPENVVVEWRGKLAAACRAELLPWAREYLLERPAQWLFQAPYCRAIDEALDPFGYEIGSARKFYLPDLTVPPAVPLGEVR